MLGVLFAKAPLDTLEHQISDDLAGDAAGRRDPRHHLSITGIAGKGDADALSVPARDLEAVQGQSEVRADRDDLPIVSAPWRLAGVALQQESVRRHQLIDVLVVKSSLAGLFTLSIKQRPDPTMPVRRAIIRQLAEGHQDLGIFQLFDIALVDDSLREDAREVESERPPTCRLRSSQRTLVGK
jgi:hypothetical protein